MVVSRGGPAWWSRVVVSPEVAEREMARTCREKSGRNLQREIEEQRARKKGGAVLAPFGPSFLTPEA